jgi:transcription initiation factor TFIID subunit 9B
MVEASGANPGSNAANPDYNEPSTQNPADSNLPLSFQTDNGLSKRPRDARLLHMVLANYGIIAYQDRVPLQLMDFAYRYTSSTLQDALHFTSEGYGTAAPGATSGKAAAHNDLSGITLSSLRLSIASRIHYQFNPTLPKEFYSEIAQDRNRVALPPVSREWGMRLPPEQYCLTGVGWDLKERYDEEMEDADDARERDATIKEEGIEGDEEEDDEEEVGRMEDLFGNDGDEDMEE